MTHLISTTYDSPVGTLTLVASDEGLRAVIWPDGRLDRVGLAGEALTPGDTPVLDATAGQLDEYFAGTRTAFDLPLDLQGTPFQLAAWQALAAIPYGETRTYGEQADRIGRPTAVRAIGAANGRNPVSIVLPCHRVIGCERLARRVRRRARGEGRAARARASIGVGGFSPVARSVVETSFPGGTCVVGSGRAEPRHLRGSP